MGFGVAAVLEEEDGGDAAGVGGRLELQRGAWCGAAGRVTMTLLGQMMGSGLPFHVDNGTA